MLTSIRTIACLCAAGLLASLSACGGDSSTRPSPQLELSGTWSGQLGQPGSTSALRLTWVATQSGNVVSGSATIVKPAVNVQGRGVMTGVVDGDRLFLTYAVPPDSIEGFPRCEIAGVGNTIATNSSIGGTLTLMFTSCTGTGLELPGSDVVRFTK